jgi:hypothetical protein
VERKVWDNGQIKQKV